MAGSSGPRMVTDGLLCHLDAGTVELTNGLAISWADYGGSQVHYQVLGNDGVIIYTTGTSWVGRFLATVVTAGFYTVMFDCVASSGTPALYLDNDGIHNDEYNSTITTSTTKQTFTKTIDITSTGAIMHYFRQGGGAGNITITNFRYFYSSILPDSSGNSNEANTIGANYSSEAGGSYYFDGTDDYMNVAGPPILYNRSTVGIWFKSPVLSVENNAFWDLSRWINTSAFIDGWAPYLDANGQVNTWGLSNDPEGGYPGWRNDYYHYVNPAGPDRRDNKWHYVVHTFRDGESDVYVDGVYYQSENSWGWPWFEGAGTKYMWIGRTQSYKIFTNYWSKYWTGHLNGMQIYNRTLTATEILQNFNVHKARYGL